MSTPLYLIGGFFGTGKTELARRVAIEHHRRFGTTVTTIPSNPELHEGQTDLATYVYQSRMAWDEIRRQIDANMALGRPTIMEGAAILPEFADSVRKSYPHSRTVLLISLEPNRRMLRENVNRPGHKMYGWSTSQVAQYARLCQDIANIIVSLAGYNPHIHVTDLRWGEYTGLIGDVSNTSHEDLLLDAIEHLFS